MQTFVDILVCFRPISYLSLSYFWHVCTQHINAVVTVIILKYCTCVNINQCAGGETTASYRYALHRILCVGYLFHVSALDSFDTDSCQVDLAV